MIGGSLKIWRSNGWFYVRFHFSISTSLKVDTEGWYCVTKGNTSFFSLLFLRSAFSLSVNLISESDLIDGFLSEFVGNLCQELVFFFLIWNVILKRSFKFYQSGQSTPKEVGVPKMQRWYTCKWIYTSHMLFLPFYNSVPRKEGLIISMVYN